MNDFGRKLKNTVLILGGFFVVLFGYARMGNASKVGQHHNGLTLQNGFDGIANADAGCGSGGDSGGDSGCK